jgi:hypothetical protein
VSANGRDPLAAPLIDHWQTTHPRGMSTDPARDPLVVALGPACDDLLCEFVTVPHVHESRSVYPLPPERPEWLIALAAEE